mgnify:FL=1
MAQRRDADYWIEQLDLDDHVEGGHYARTYTCDVVADGEGLPEEYTEERSTASSIYYLLRDDEFSTFHRIDADELWHFYRGDPLRLYLLGDELETVVLGRDQFQTVVPRDTWFAAEVVSDPDDAGTDDEAAHGYTLVGCDVTPAFEDATYELADEERAEELAAEFEKHRELVERLT